MPTLKNGKLPGRLLQNLIDGLPNVVVDKRVVVGPGVGEDAAHILFGENTLLAKSDPITFTTDRIGWYAVNVNANDIAVAGGTPKWFLATLMLPPETDESTVRAIFSDLGTAASDIGVQLVGGHTEVTPAVNQPVICGFMLGEAPTSATVSASGAKPGDVVILTKGIAIEGASILANECRADLVERGVSITVIEDAAALLNDPGISVLKDAQTVVSAGGITAMHDPTEGGLATALQELALASNNNIVVDPERVPVIPSCQTICEALDIDPWGLISSGALLATVEPDRAVDSLDALREAGIPADVIGRVTPIPQSDTSPTVYADDGTASIPLNHFERDELARYFEQP